MSSTPSKKTVFVFDQPRTCSNLFHKLFSSHPDITQTALPFATRAWYSPARIGIFSLPPDRLDTSVLPPPPATEGELQEHYPNEKEMLMEWIESVEREGKVPWVKDHTLLTIDPRVLHQLMNNPVQSEGGNPTVLPDEIFFSEDLKPIFLIRHPALILPSYLRAQAGFLNLSASDQVFETYTTNRFTRHILDSYLAAGRGGDVTVIDASDLLSNTEAVVEKLCGRVGLDPKGVVYEWGSRPLREKGSVMGGWDRHFYADVLQSTNVFEKPREDVIDIDVEEKKWIEEFGEDAAGTLRRLVDAEMEGHGYLRQFRLVP